MSDDLNIEEIRNFLDTVTADDFDRTSAHDESHYTKEITGQARFNAFTHFHLEAARIAYAASDGYMNPWAVLHRPDARRMFVPDDDETVSMFVNRLAREAQDFGATWFFIAMVGPGGYAEETEDIPSGEQVFRGEATSDTFKPAINWYAESIEPKVEAVRYGIVTIENGRARSNIENEVADHAGASPLFTQVMRAVAR